MDALAISEEMMPLIIEALHHRNGKPDYKFLSRTYRRLKLRRYRRFRIRRYRYIVSINIDTEKLFTSDFEYLLTRFQPVAPWTFHYRRGYIEFLFRDLEDRIMFDLLVA